MPSFALPPVSPSTNPFLDSLFRALGIPIDWEEFLSSYGSAIETVAAPGRFRLHGMVIDTPSGVYSPHETSSTRFVCDHFDSLGLLAPKQGMTALEVGSGAGAISILLAKTGWDVTAIDIDPNAVKATADNAFSNGVVIDSYESDLFSKVSKKFDVIIFNQPLFHKSSEIAINERTLSSEGSALYARFMEEALVHLLPGGRVVVTYANFSAPAAMIQPGWEVRVKAFDYEGARHTVKAILEATPLL